MSSEIVSALVGGLVGGVLGVVGTIASAYWGPRKLDEWRESRVEERLNGPRKKLLQRMLDDPRFQDGRSLKQLRLATGCSEEECRRLLVEIGARGLTHANDEEGWALISKKPLNDQ